MTIKAFTLDDIESVPLVAYMIGVDEYWLKIVFKGCTNPVDFRAVKTGDAFSQAVLAAVNAGTYGEPRHGLGCPIGDYSEGFRTQPTSQEDLEAQIRENRDQLLIASDWTDTTAGQGRLSDAQKTAYATYRQELRDVTNQATFPWEINWPVKPA